MNIWIWGTGLIAKHVMQYGLQGEIKGFIETEKTKERFLDYPVISVQEIPQDFDYIFVANRFSDDIYDLCVTRRMELTKIIFLIRGKKTEYISLTDNIRDILGERNLTEYQVQYGVLTDTFVEKDKILYQHLNQRKNFEIKNEYMWPIISEKYAKNGAIGNYFWQDLWAARKVIESGVKEHFDIGSRVDGFISHLLAAGITVKVIDIRPIAKKVENLFTILDDATMLSQLEDNSTESMSALCSLEHFGLGRYGDAIDPEACFKCFFQIQKKIRKGGNLFISVPIGMERVEFNAHRVFYAKTVIDNFSYMKLIEFSCTAEGNIEYNANIHKYDADSHNGDFRYGLFHFIKK